MNQTRKATRKNAPKQTVRYIYVCRKNARPVKAKKVRETALFVLEKAADLKEIVSMFAEGMTVVVFRHQLTVTEIAVVLGIIVALALVKVNVKK